MKNKKNESNDMSLLQHESMQLKKSLSLSRHLVASRGQPVTSLRGVYGVRGRKWGKRREKPEASKNGRPIYSVKNPHCRSSESALGLLDAFALVLPFHLRIPRQR